MLEAVQTVSAPVAPPQNSEELFVKKVKQDLTNFKTHLEDKEAKLAQGEEEMGKFVGYFYSFMLQKMRETVPDDGPFNAGRAEKIFQQQMDLELGNQMAQEKQNNRLNPLTQQMVDTFLGKLDKEIEQTKKDIVQLENMLLERNEKTLEQSEAMKAPLNDQKDYDELRKELSLGQKEIRKALETEAGRVPVALKVSSKSD